MYKLDIENKKLIPIPATTYRELNLRERFDIQEWIAGTPEILGEPLLVIAKELVLPSGRRLDLLAVDKEGALAVIELKRDSSGSETEWQAIKYASYCSSFTHEDVYEHFAEYLGTDADDAQLKIEGFVDCEPEDVNERQRIILVSKEFHSEVISAVLWLREAQIDIQCTRLVPYRDENGDCFIDPETIIPLPEAKDYIQKKESKHKEQRLSSRSTFSLEKSNLGREELKGRIVETLMRSSDLTPRFRAFLEIISEEDRVYDREEVKQGLYEAGIGLDIGQAGRYLSNISQFLTKKSNPHLRQLIEFESGGTHGETKNNYRVQSEYRDLVYEALEETAEAEGEAARDGRLGDAETARRHLG